MERNEVSELLAGYLEHELSTPDRERFEARLAADPALAAEVAGLRRALVELRSLDDPVSALAATPSLQAVSRHRSANARGRGWMVAALRYAAVVAVAFIAGFAARSAGVVTPPGASRDSAATSLGAIVTLPEIAGFDEAAAARLAAAYNSSSVEPGMARSLVALSVAMRAPQGAERR